MSHSGRGGVPKYALIAARLRGLIIAGELAPGDRVPSEPEITDRWQVSKTTAARALDLLAAEGLIRRVSGSGSFVAAAPAAVVVEARPGARVTARAAAQREIGEAPPGTPLLTVEQPGSSPVSYRADLTIVVAVCDHEPGVTRGGRPG